MKHPKLNPEDAQALIVLAESAPLQNMAHSRAMAGVLQRMAAYFNAVMEAQNKEEETADEQPT